MTLSFLPASVFESIRLQRRYLLNRRHQFFGAIYHKENPRIFLKHIRKKHFAHEWKLQSYRLLL